ncbi:MAG: hypothetical protein HY519_03690 [Candidatus Aenigmarchaeota archaeon]|nr:hypothetical protein [Candidatus Aenigmarchaeota archaeon]
MEKFECHDCGKKFDGQGSLAQHAQVVHNRSAPAPKPIAPANKRYLALFVGLVFIAAGFVAYTSSAPGKYDDFAKCLTDKGLKFYGAFWCPHCASQKELFGSSIKYVNYIECSTPDRSAQTQVCIDAKIKSYPTWGFPDGKLVEGVLSLEDLGRRSGCSLQVGNSTG